MRYGRERSSLRSSRERSRRMRRFLALPLLTLALIAFILIADRVRNGSEREEKTEAESGGVQVSEEETREPYDYANAVPERSADEALNALVKRYLDARVNGDADEMYRLFGIADQTGLEGLRQKMAEEKKLYDSFENISVYALPGVSEDSWIIYVSTQGWFKKVETPAPMLFRSYVVKTDEGVLAMKQDGNLTDEEAAAVKAADGSEAVRRMNMEQRTELAKAIVSDAKLGSIYEKLRVGAAEALESAESAAEESVAVTDAVVEIDAGSKEETEQVESAEAESSAEGESEAEAGTEAPESEESMEPAAQ